MVRIIPKPRPTSIRGFEAALAKKGLAYEEIFTNGERSVVIRKVENVRENLGKTVTLLVAEMICEGTAL